VDQMIRHGALDQHHTLARRAKPLGLLGRHALPAPLASVLFSHVEVDDHSDHCERPAANDRKDQPVNWSQRSHNGPVSPDPSGRVGRSSRTANRIGPGGSGQHFHDRMTMRVAPACDEVHGLAEARGAGGVRWTR
jgi:hypothetical protein